MNTMIEQMVKTLMQQMEVAWNAADGAAYSAVFMADADFVNIRGEYHQTRQAIATGHQQIFNTIYKGSQVQYTFVDSRPLADTVILAHVKGMLNVPTGPLVGVHHSLATVVLVLTEDAWRIAAFHNTLQPLWSSDPSAPMAPSDG